MLAPIFVQNMSNIQEAGQGGGLILKGIFCNLRGNSEFQFLKFSFFTIFSMFKKVPHWQNYDAQMETLTLDVKYYAS